MDNEYEVGMFIVTTHKPDPAKSSDVGEWLRAMSPQGRIDRLRKMAAQVGIEVPELDEAQEIAANGTKGKRGQIFNNLLHRAKDAIHNAAPKEILEKYQSHRQKQEERAKNPRNPIITEAIESLAKRPREFKAKDLWPELIGMLDDPVEVTPNKKQPDTWYVKHTTDRGEKTYKFKSFKSKLSTARKKEL